SCARSSVHADISAAWCVARRVRRTGASLAVRIAQKQRYGAAVRKDFSHKLTHDLASSEAQYFVLEALNVSGMVRRPKAKQEPVTGKWLANGRRAKAGLNKSILASCWGVIHEQLTYKAARRNKL